MNTYQNRILKPDKVSIDENIFFEFDIKDLSDHYDKVFGVDKNKRNYFVQWIFKIILSSNKDIIIILAGSLASIPVNILTGFFNSSSYMCFEWILHILQLIISILFYISFLIFVRFFLYIRSRGNEYVNYVLVKFPYSSKIDIEKAVKNIEYFSCMEKYKYVRMSLICLLIFGLLLVVLLFIPSVSFENL